VREEEEMTVAAKENVVEMICDRIASEQEVYGAPITRKHMAELIGGFVANARADVLAAALREVNAEKELAKGLRAQEARRDNPSTAYVAGYNESVAACERIAARLESLKNA
jgi:hypothetical protein